MSTMSAVEEVVRLAQARRELPPPAMCRALRERAGLSLADMARAAGTSKQSVHNWESGRCVPGPEHIHDYLTVLRAVQELG